MPALQSSPGVDSSRRRAQTRLESIPMDGGLDEVHGVLWHAIRHLFPPHAMVNEPKPGWLSITWSMEGDPDAMYLYATPILIRMEDDLLDALWTCPARDSQRRIAANQETTVRLGMRGYDPYASLPNSRVIVLG